MHDQQDNPMGDEETMDHGQDPTTEENLEAENQMGPLTSEEGEEAQAAHDAMAQEAATSADEAGFAFDDFSETAEPTAVKGPHAPPQIDKKQESHTAADLEAVYNVPVNITAVLGRSHLEVSDLLALEEGDIVELDRKVGEAIDIYVNDRLVARGEVVLVDDKLGVTMTEIIKAQN